MKIVKWLRSGVFDENIQENLISTLDVLERICPLKMDKETIFTLYNVIFLNTDIVF
jgi:hypothetical protein